MDGAGGGRVYRRTESHPKSFIVAIGRAVDGKGAAPPELAKAQRVEWLHCLPGPGSYADQDERELTRLGAALGYYNAYSAWAQSSRKADLIESAPQLAALAGEIESYRMEEMKARRKAAGLPLDNDNYLLAALGLDEKGNPL